MSETLEKILRKHGIKVNEIDLGELLELLAKAHGDYERKEHPDCYDDDAYSYDDYYSAGGKTDEINHPAHYNDGIECIDYIESHHMNFNRGNAIKYVTRAGFKSKDAVSDLEKAKWYIQREIDTLKESDGEEWE